MSLLAKTIRREFRVATSLRVQPLWFRILKWIVILVLVVGFHDRTWFWGVLAGCIAAALFVHFLYRFKTRTWTRPWGGWNDLEAGHD